MFKCFIPAKTCAIRLTNNSEKLALLFGVKLMALTIGGYKKASFP